MNNLQMTAQIKAERKKYEAEEVMHNRELHQQILSAWEQDSSKMVERLKKLGILDDLAFVSQERMWRRAKELRQSGLPVTDAREMAERETLMLEPETLPDPARRMTPEAESAMLPTRK